MNKLKYFQRLLVISLSFSSLSQGAESESHLIYRKPQFSDESKSLMTDTDKEESRQIFALAMQSLERNDFKNAFELFEEAANLGHAIAEFNIGVLYEYGRAEGKKVKNLKKAAEWYTKAIKDGFDDEKVYKHLSAVINSYSQSNEY